jgi:hypothetical protein
MPAQTAKIALGTTAFAAMLAVGAACARSTAAGPAQGERALVATSRDSVTALFECAREVSQDLGYYAVDTAYYRQNRWVQLVLAPHERAVIAGRDGVNRSRFLIAVAGTDSAGRPVLHTTAREYDWSHHLVAVENGFPSLVRFRGLTSVGVRTPLSPEVASDLQQLRESCASLPSTRGAD